MNSEAKDTQPHKEKQYICIMGSNPELDDVYCDFYQQGKCTNKRYCNQKAEIK